MKKSISAILISVILVTFTFGTAFAKEEYRIKFGYSASDKEANIITFYNTFEKYVEEASGGRIAVDVYANAQLGGERQMLEGMTLGMIEMAMLSPGIAANIAPKFQVIDLPYLFNDRAAAYKALDGKLGQTLNEQILPKGVRLLCFPENGFHQITNNKGPIKSPADLKGVKVRVQPIPAHLELFKAFGANPTPVDFGELYTALLQKTVDAQENSITLIYSSKLYEVQKYLTMSNHVYAPSAVFMSEAFYKRLPADLQKIVMDGAKKFRDASRANQQKEGDRLLKEMVEKNGLKVYYPTDAEMKQFRDAAQPVYKTMEPVLGKELIDMAREANKK
ncbi:DctP family TRAP transporter solute-binding subunit [Cloacibacillus sp.]|uniref:TRAP transporter substrate-binding protein n=1 Tax=Cloacibacillus sp. TaxID=2049023 RepID=UPI0025C6CCBA|nr:DctP family TRAP transporter solute-binding subunit [Cloacibacillus sp.]MCC8056762.1 DctP family TRAP transporter solute-binding subunit [Cloacibacillus sp.]